MARYLHKPSPTVQTPANVQRPYLGDLFASFIVTNGADIYVSDWLVHDWPMQSLEICLKTVSVSHGIQNHHSKTMYDSSGDNFFFLFDKL